MVAFLSQHLGRAVDYRSDLYSLGAVLYHLASGLPPHGSGQDRATIARSAVSTVPTPLATVVSRADGTEVPKEFSDIVTALLQPSPSERYQSAFGLLHDLKLCVAGQRHWQPRARDVPAYLRSTDNVVGRTGELDSLYTAFARAANGHSECVVLSGASGIGKTALLRRFVNSLPQAALYGRGKCDKSAAGKPYHVLSVAVDELLRGALVLPDSEVEAYTRRLVTALEGQEQVLPTPPSLPPLRSLTTTTVLHHHHHHHCVPTRS